MSGGNEGLIYGNGAEHPADIERRMMLEKIRDDRAAIAARRAAREAAAGPAEELAQAKIQLENEAALDAAEAEHGPVDVKIAAVYASSGKVVIVKRPHRALFQRFQDAGKFTSTAVHKLIQPCLVHPDQATFDAWLDDEPALLGRVSHHIAILAGVRNEDLQGK